MSDINKFAEKNPEYNKDTRKQRAFNKKDLFIIVPVLVIAAVTGFVFFILSPKRDVPAEAPPEAASALQTSASGAYASDEGKKTVVVSVSGVKVLSADLNTDAMYIIEDGEARETDMYTSISDLGTEVYANKHDINLILIKDGAVSCSESNCDNQVCVHSGRMTGSSSDFPIVCLPHGMAIEVK